MERLENVATPFTADTGVADSVPPLGLVPMPMVMLALEPVTVLPKVSCTVTCTAGEIATPATALLGCTETASLAAAAGVMLNAAEVPPVSPDEAAFSV